MRFRFLLAELYKRVKRQPAIMQSEKFIKRRTLRVLSCVTRGPETCPAGTECGRPSPPQTIGAAPPAAGPPRGRVRCHPDSLADLLSAAGHADGAADWRLTAAWERLSGCGTIMNASRINVTSSPAKMRQRGTRKKSVSTGSEASAQRAACGQNWTQTKHDLMASEHSVSRNAIRSCDINMCRLFENIILLEASYQLD